MKTILITGAAGFVGHHAVENFLKNTDYQVIGMDSLTYSGTWDRLRDIKIYYGPLTDLDGQLMYTAYDHPRFRPLVWDFRKPAEPNLIKELESVTHILHMGAQSHVDNSVKEPMKFVEANIIGTVNMLELARQLPNLELFVQFSTDEICGSAPMDHSFKGFKENERYNKAEKIKEEEKCIEVFSD